MNILESLKQRMVVWVWEHTPNCAEMSRLASRSCEESLPLQARIKIRLHYFICVWCKRYARHLHFLREAAPQLCEHVDSLGPRGLSLEARQRIVRRLQTEQAGL
jgi:hypothetical protein